MNKENYSEIMINTLNKKSVINWQFYIKKKNTILQKHNSFEGPLLNSFSESIVNY